MALNKTILEKISQKTEGDIKLKNFLVEILQIESRGKGWFKSEYSLLIEKYCKAGDMK